MNLSEFRYQMLERGWMNKKELATFTGLGRKKAEKLFQLILIDQEKEGIERIDGNIVLTKRVLIYCGLTEKKVIDAYFRKLKS